MENQKNNKVIHIALWIGQALVALLLLWGAYAKLFLPMEEISEMLPWATENPMLAKFTGIVDLLGGLGLILPALLRIQPKLTIYAAYGTGALMIGASIFHLSRGESGAIGMNIFILLIALFIAWGRSKKAPILPK
ncbi:MAG: DoxX family protein [Bacteroidia bacterium]